MLVQIILNRNDGTVLVRQVVDALRCDGWQAGVAGPIIEGDNKLYGFTYTPWLGSDDRARACVFCGATTADRFRNKPLCRECSETIKNLD